MTSFTSILDTNELPPADSKIVYQYYNDANELCEVSSFLSDASEKDVIRAVDSLRAQANEDHHIFIEGFIQRDEDRAYRVILGS